jgi:hypothetical protein
MRRQPWGLYAIAAAILVVGLVALGVPAQTLLFAALVLACPLMMLTMHGGMGHAGHGATPSRPTDTVSPAASGHGDRSDDAGGAR